VLPQKLGLTVLGWQEKGNEFGVSPDSTTRVRIRAFLGIMA